MRPEKWRVGTQRIFSFDFGWCEKLIRHHHVSSKSDKARSGEAEHFFNTSIMRDFSRICPETASLWTIPRFFEDALQKRGPDFLLSK